MYELIIYLSIAGDVSLSDQSKSFETMEECMFRAGAYIGALLTDDSIHGKASEWHDINKDGYHEAVIWALEDNEGDGVTVICTSLQIKELL